MCLHVHVCNPGCEVIQGFVKGIRRGLCQLLSWPVNSHSFSQAMCSASFVWHIIMRYIILPYYCHMIAKLRKESQKWGGIPGEPGWKSSQLSFSNFLTPCRAWAGRSALVCGWREKRRRGGGRRRGSRREREIGRGRGRGGGMAGAASLGEVPDRCWSQEQDWLGLCVRSVCTGIQTHKQTHTHTHKSICRMNRHIDVTDLRQTRCNVTALTNWDTNT